MCLNLTRVGINFDKIIGESELLLRLVLAMYHTHRTPTSNCVCRAELRSKLGNKYVGKVIRRRNREVERRRIPWWGNYTHWRALYAPRNRLLLANCQQVWKLSQPLIIHQHRLAESSRRVGYQGLQHLTSNRGAATWRLALHYLVADRSLWQHILPFWPS